MNLNFKRTTETWSEFRRRVSRLATNANKRLARIEKNEVENTPAYKAVVDQKGERPRFGVKGKTNMEVAREFWQLQRFLSAKTSTIKGIRRVAEDTAKTLGTPFKKGTPIKTLVVQSANYFALADTIQEYLNKIHRSAMALDYNRIFNAVNTVIARDKTELANLRNDGKAIADTMQATLKELQVDIEQDVKESLKNTFGEMWGKN